MVNVDDPRHLKRPTREQMEKRLSRLGLTPEDVRVPAVVVRAGEVLNFGSCAVSMRAFRRPLPKARSLDHVKEMIGVPNHVFANRPADRIFDVREEDVLREGVHLLHRRHPTPSAAYKMAVNMVYRFFDPALLERSPYRELSQMIVAAVDGLSAIVGDDLIVENGATADLGTEPVVSFNRIIVYGTGRIVVHDQQTVQANVVQYIPNA